MTAVNRETDLARFLQERRTYYDNLSIRDLYLVLLHDGSMGMELLARVPPVNLTPAEREKFINFLVERDRRINLQLRPTLIEADLVDFLRTYHGIPSTQELYLRTIQAGVPPVPPLNLTPAERRKFTDALLKHDQEVYLLFYGSGKRLPINFDPPVPMLGPFVVFYPPVPQPTTIIPQPTIIVPPIPRPISPQPTTLRQLHDQLGANQVLDVSRINLETGDGAIIREEREIFDLNEPPWSSNYAIAAIDIVSNKLPQLVAAIVMIRGTEALGIFQLDIVVAAHRLARFGPTLMNGRVVTAEQYLRPIPHAERFGDRTETLVPPQPILPRPTVPLALPPPIPTIRIPATIQPFTPAPLGVTQPIATRLPFTPTPPIVNEVMIPALQHLEDQRDLALMTYLRTQTLKYRAMDSGVLHQDIVTRGLLNRVNTTAVLRTADQPVGAALRDQLVNVLVEADRNRYLWNQTHK